MACSSIRTIRTKPELFWLRQGTPTDSASTSKLLEGSSGRSFEVEAGSVPVPRLSQQSSGFVPIVPIQLQAIYVPAGDARRKRTTHRHRFTAQHDFDQLVLVDRVLQRLADFLLLEYVGIQEAGDQDDGSGIGCPREGDTR